MSAKQIVRAYTHARKTASLGAEKTREQIHSGSLLVGFALGISTVMVLLVTREQNILSARAQTLARPRVLSFTPRTQPQQNETKLI